MRNAHKHLIGFILGLTLLTQFASAHCEVPCGIYDDAARIDSMQEDTQTIRKAMLAIESKETNVNQKTRWVMTKEAHAQKIQDLCAQYFLTQRIKSSMDNYEAQLKSLHAILVAAMKAKQNTDVSFADELDKAIHEFKHLYLGDHHH